MPGRQFLCKEGKGASTSLLPSLTCPFRARRSGYGSICSGHLFQENTLRGELCERGDAGARDAPPCREESLPPRHGARGTVCTNSVTLAARRGAAGMCWKGVGAGCGCAAVGVGSQ